MRLLGRAALLLAVLALCAGTVGAPGAAAQGHLDPGFGEAGIVRVDAPLAKYGTKEMAFGPEGRVYVLDGSLLLAYESGGAPAAGFGEDGRVAVAPAGGEGRPTGLAVDPEGRVLVVGSVHQPGQKASQGYVIRFLPDGARDVAFGNGGEVDTDFELPPVDGQEVTSVSLAALTVDAQGRPVVGGSFVTAKREEDETCGAEFEPAPHPFVARLTSKGALDGSFAGSGTAALAGQGGVESLTMIADGGLVATDYVCSTPPRFESRSPNFTTFGEDGETSPSTTERGCVYAYLSPVADPGGRVFEIEGVQPAAEGTTEALVRCRPEGRFDPSFGKHGRVVLHLPGEVDALAVDAAGRPLVATTGRRGIELFRFQVDGRPDRGFGPHGRLTARIPSPRSIALDPNGLIYVMGVRPKGGIAIARFVPGR